MHKVDLDGIIYRLEKRDDCTGCSAVRDGKLCETLSTTWKCAENKIIFIPTNTEEIFTRSEVIDIVKEYYGDDDFMTEALIDAFDEYSKKRKLQNDPEYLKYLELRKKFE